MSDDLLFYVLLIMNKAMFFNPQNYRNLHLRFGFLSVRNTS